MNITINSRNSNIPQNTRDYATEKAKKLDKFYKLRKISIVMEVEGETYRVEIVAYPERGGNRIIGNSINAEWFSAIDQASDKVERQLRKLKGKVKSHRMKKQVIPEAPEKPEEKEETYKDIVDKMEESQ